MNKKQDIVEALCAHALMISKESPKSLHKDTAKLLRAAAKAIQALRVIAWRPVV